MNLEQFNTVLNDAASPYCTKLNAIYSSSSCDFPIWIRQECDEIFNQHQWETILTMSNSTSNFDQKNAQSYASELYHSLLKACDDRLTAVDGDQKRVEVRKDICHNIQERYGDCPMILVETLVRCRNQELALWEEYISVKESQEAVSHIQVDSPMDILTDSNCSTQSRQRERNLPLEIVHLKSLVDVIEKDLSETRQRVSDYSIDATFIQDNKCNIKEKQSEWKAVTESVILARAGLAKNIEHCEQMATELLPLLDLKIVDWKEMQKFHFLGLKSEPSLKELSQQCSDVGQKLYTMIEVCDRCETFNIWRDYIEGVDVEVCQTQIKDIYRFKQEFMKKLTNHIQRSCIQVKQPLSIINVSNSPHFGSTIRILGLEKIPINGTCEINVELLSEMKLEGREQEKKTTFKLQNGSSILAKKSSINEEVIAEFPSLQVREFKRPKRPRKMTPTGSGNNLFVCEEKFRLVFTGDFSLLPYIGTVPLRAVSLPVTLTTNSSQFSDCHAAQLWQCFNTSADNDHGPYVFPPVLPWPKVKEMLNTKMEEQTGRGLPEDQLCFLADKLAGEEGNTDYDNLNVTWQRFAKEKLANGKFSFWRWFHACVNLLQHVLNKEWNDGRIYGFISKNKAKSLLRKQDPGVFLLRFSESTINESGTYITGSVSPVIVSIVETNGKAKKRIEHIDPYTTKHISMKGSLGQVLAKTDDAELKYLYPDKIPLLEAFKDYNNSCGCDPDHQEDGNGVYVGRHIHFKLSRLQIKEEDEEEESNSDGEESQYFNSVSPSSTITSNPSSVSTIMSMDQPFSPEQTSLPLSSPQVAPQQGSLSLSSPQGAPLQSSFPLSSPQGPPLQSSFPLSSPQEAPLQSSFPLSPPQGVPLQSSLPLTSAHVAPSGLLSQLLADPLPPQGIDYVIKTPASDPQTTDAYTDFPMEDDALFIIPEDALQQLNGIFQNVGMELPPK